MRNIYMKRLAASSLFMLAAMALGCSVERRPEPVFNMESFFPAEKGSYWLYEGTVRHPVASAGNVELVTRNVTVRMEVVNSVRRPTCVVSIIRGYPADANWCTGEIKRNQYMKILTQKGKVFIAQSEEQEMPVNLDFQGGNAIDVHYRKVELPLTWPMSAGMKICDDDALGSSGIACCWNVNGVEVAGLHGIRGIERGGAVRHYLLTLRTGPDRQDVSLVPGIGIVRYRYSHTGTVFETDLKLVEFRRPGAK